ncbi:MAG: PadR family transcriptional regulator [Eubacteriales bacterium]|nr:PadR family transcriptional regulator [Eubacteriales bacterium]
MSLKHGLLGLLSYGSMTGYELNKTFEDSLDYFWQAKSSQIYRELDAMEACGWLTSHIQLQTDRPNRRVYCITEAGRGELKSWLEGPFTPGSVRDPFMMRVFFGGECPPQRTRELLRAFAQDHEKNLGTQDETLDMINAYARKVEDPEKAVYWNMTAEFHRRYARMCMQWAQDMEKMLKNEEDENA